MSDETPTRYTVAVDFDGVLHSYASGWQGADVIPDPPIAGAIDWLNEIAVEYDIVILTTRGRYPEGVAAVSEWLTANGYGGGALVTAEKVPALIYIDDRAWRFKGRFPTLKTIRYAKPWREGDPEKRSVKAVLDDRRAEVRSLHEKQAAAKHEIRRLRRELLSETLRHTYTEDGVETWLAANEGVSFEEKLDLARGLKGMVAT